MFWGYPFTKKGTVNMKKWKHYLSVLVVLVCIMIPVGISVVIYDQRKVFKEDEQKYDDIREDMITIPKETTLVANTESESKLPEKVVDFESLAKVNKDIVGWVYIPGTHIDYPLLQEPVVGEYFYLKHSFDKSKAYCGSLFMAKSDIESIHTVIFGHNMRNTSMFGDLDLYKKESFYQANPYVYIYYPSGLTKWQVSSACNVLDTDMVYTMPYLAGDVAYSDLLDHLTRSSLYKTDCVPDVNTPTITLSTCSGKPGSYNRFIVTLVQIVE